MSSKGITGLLSSVLLVLFLTVSPAFADGTLWFGNDTVGNVFQTSTTGTVLTDLGTLPVTGIAWDGNHLYMVDREGNFTVRTPDGATVLRSFFVASNDTGEDLAFDGTRGVLWRIVHTNVLQEIDPTTGTLITSYLLPTADPVLGPLGGLGIAYDPTRDRLYVSYCQQGCTGLVAGLVQVIDPNTGLVLSDLFRTDFYSGGLAYDPFNDSLWIGGTFQAYDMALDGTLLTSFNKPPAGFADGLEFVPQVPEPSSLVLLGSGIAGLAGAVRKRLKV